MPCYHPNEAFLLTNEDTGERRILFKTVSSLGKRKHNESITEILLPCGQCVGCRLEYSRQWAIRCLLEAKQHEHNWFVTLTYDEDNVPMSIGQDGVARMTLEKNALSSFMKRLRRHFEYHEQVQNIRFFGVGEYGSKSLRPHYHIIIFGLDLNDLELHSLNNGFPLFRSSTLESLWPYGFVSVGAVSFQSAAYVARYSLKKEKGRHADKYYRSLGIVPEYVRMSRRPGIAREYYDENSGKIYRYDDLVISNGDGPVHVKPPKYFDRLFRACHEDEFRALSEERRERADRAFKREMEGTSVDDMYTYLATKEGNKLCAVRSLVREI